MSLKPAFWKLFRSPAAWGWGLIFLTTACTPPAEFTAPSPEPTNVPAPTHLQLTETATPFTQITPGLVYEGDVFQPEASPTPIPVVLPLEELVILEPGDGSHVTSPFQIKGYLRSGGHREVTLRLLDGQGKPIAEASARLRAIGDQPYFFITSLEFEMDTVAGAARLEVRASNPTGGQIDHLASVRLTLLSLGPGQVHPVIRGPERITILEPPTGSTLSPGAIDIRGTAWSDSWTPLSIQLSTSSGELIAEGTAVLYAPGLGQLGLYETHLTFQLDTPTDAHLLVCEVTAELLQPIHCASAPLLLSP